MKFRFTLPVTTRYQLRLRDGVGLSQMEYRRFVDAHVKLDRCVEADRQALMQPRRVDGRRRSAYTQRTVAEPARIDRRRTTVAVFDNEIESPSIIRSSPAPRPNARRPFFLSGRRPLDNASSKRGRIATDDEQPASKNQRLNETTSERAPSTGMF